MSKYQKQIHRNTRQGGVIPNITFYYPPLPHYLQKSHFTPITAITLASPYHRFCHYSHFASPLSITIIFSPTYILNKLNILTRKSTANSCKKMQSQPGEYITSLSLD